MSGILWLKWLHIVAALWMAAGAFAVPVVRVQLVRSRELPQRLVLLRLLRRLHSFYLIPGLLAAGVSGIGLLHPLGYGFRPGWVHASLALWLVLVVWSLSVGGPFLKELQKAAEGAISRPEAQEELERLLAKRTHLLLFDLNALAVLLFTYLMVLRPF